MEPGTPSLDRAADVVEPGVENEVAELPHDHLLIWNRLEVILARHFSPKRRLVRHIDGQGHRHGFGHLHLEHPGDTAPRCAWAKARLKNQLAATTFTQRYYARGPLLYAPPGA